MADQTINLNLIPDGVLPVVRANQCDVKRTMTFTIYEGNDLYTIPTGTVIEVQGMKGDNHVFVYGETDLLSDNTPIVAWSGNTITLNTSMQMTAAAGDARVLFVLTNGAETLGTLMFIMRVQQNPAIDGDISDSELPAIIARATEQMQRAEAAATSAAEDASDAEAWAVGERNGTPVSSDDDTYHNNSEYYSTQAGNSATTASNAKDDAVAAANRAESWSAHPPYIGANGNWYIWNIPNEQYQDSGVDASITLTIQDITMLAYNATPTVTNSGTNTDAVFHLGIPRAPVVSSVTKTGTAGLVDTYTMELQDGTTAGTFTVTNGADGEGSVSTVNNVQPVGGNVTLNLDDINDVDFSNLADGDALVYDASTQKWTNGEGGGGTTIVQLPTVTVGTYTYNGTAQGPTITGLDTEHCTVTNATATNAGSYTLTIALNNSNKMVWNDLTNTPKTYNYTINKAVLAVPTVTNTSKTYTGAAQSPTITGFDNATMTQSGNTATNAGNYTVSFGLADSDNYVWNSATTSFSWTIAKASGTVTLSKNAITLSGNATTDTVIISDATGVIFISSSDTTIATVSPSTMTAPGGTLTVTSPNKVSGTSTITVSVAASDNYNATSDTIAFTGNYAQIYGAEWDGTSTTAWTRTDEAASFVDPSPAVNNGTGSSPFDDIMPWSGMTKETRTGGVMVKIPKFWYKWTFSGSSIKLQIANAETDGFSVSPAHADRGDGVGERDYVYVGRYHSGSGYTSATGVLPLANLTRASFRSGMSALGSGIWQWDYAMLETIWMLYLVEFADWNSQAKIGYGCGNNSSVVNTGITDAMQYHTGTNVASRTTYGHVQYRWIEDLWGNVLDWCDGIYFSGSDIYVIKNPANFSDTSNGTKVGTRPTSSGWISAWSKSSVSGYEWFIYPSAVAGSETTYTSDYYYYGSPGVVLRMGGSYSHNQGYGPFYLADNYPASDKSSSIGSRLQELPS